MAEQLHSNYLDTFLIKLNPEFSMEQHVITHGFWESPSLWVFEQSIKPGFFCIDVGANAGLLSLAMAKAAGMSGRVFCFEPSNSVFPRLVDNINLNPQWRPVLTAEKMGLGEREGYYLLQEQGGGNAQISGEYDNSTPENVTGLCIISTLDKLFSGHRVDFLKVDVEGMELEVFRGGSQLIQSQRPLIWYESELEHGWFDPQKVKACEELLRSLGYELFKVHPDRRLIPVAFPDYEVNSLAVPVEKKAQISELI